jgi:lipopolysaccharide export system permease protein
MPKPARMAILTAPALPGATSIDRYLLRQLVIALIATTGGLTALIWLTQSLHFITLVVDRGLSLLSFLTLTGLLLPSFVAVILPITTYVVIQFVYARLDGDRELTVMRAAGLSPFALARPALALAAMSMGVCFVLNLYVLPTCYVAFRERQMEIRNRLAAFLLEDGVFTQISPDLTVYVRRRDPDGTLHGVLIDDARNKSSRATILAENGRMIELDNTPRVLLLNGSRQEIDKQTGRLDILTFAQNTIDLTPKREGAGEKYHDISELSLHELLHPTPPYFARDLPKMVVEAHKRLSGPLTAGSLALVALATVLTGSFRRYGGLLRPMIAVGVVMLLLASQLLIGNLAGRDLALLPLLWLQAVLPGLVCMWLLFGEAVQAWMRGERDLPGWSAA